MSEKLAFHPDDTSPRDTNIVAKIEVVTSKGDKLASDHIYELFKLKEALLEAALAYNIIAAQFQQELINLDFRTGCTAYTIDMECLRKAMGIKAHSTLAYSSIASSLAQYRYYKAEDERIDRMHQEDDDAKR